jgi:hypothetical protein
MLNKTNMATFKVDNNDSARVMFDKLNSYIVTIKKEKYNNILKLLNELFEKNHSSLRNFTEINGEYFEKIPLSKIIKILETHKEKFNYDISKIVDSNTNIAKAKDKSKSDTNVIAITKAEDTNVSKKIFSIIGKILRTIEYKLIRFSKGSKFYYSITMC